jgi:hypothetical protein
MRRWRRHLAEPGASSRACTDADASSNADANPNTDADAHANAKRWDDDHHHVRRRVTQDADRAGGNARHVREQRHAAS